MAGGFFGLTQRQREALRYLAIHRAVHGQMPKLKECCATLGVSSRSTVHRLLHCLEERGYIRRHPNTPRGIELLRPVPVSTAPDGAPLYFVAVPTTTNARPAPALTSVAHFHDGQITSGDQQDHV